MKFEKFSYKNGNYWIRTLDDNKYVSYYRRGTSGTIEKTPVYTNYDQIKYQALAMIDDGYLTEYSNAYNPNSKLWNGKRSFQEGDKKTSTRINGGAYGTESYIESPYTLYVKYDADGTGNNYPAKLWVEYDKGDSVGVIGPVIANNYTYKNKVKGALNKEAKAVFESMSFTETDYRYGMYWIRELGEGKFVGYYKISLEGAIHESNIYSSYSEIEEQIKKPLDAWYEKVNEEQVDENDDMTKEDNFGEMEVDVVNLDKNEVIKGMKFALWQDITAVVSGLLAYKEYEVYLGMAKTDPILCRNIQMNGRYSREVLDDLYFAGYITENQLEKFEPLLLVGGEEKFKELISDQNFDKIGEVFHPEKFFVDGMQDAVQDIFIGYAELLDYQTYVDLFKFSYGISKGLLKMDTNKLKTVFGEAGEKLAYIWDNQEAILSLLSESDRQYFEGYMTFVVGTSLLPVNKLSQARNIGSKVIDIERKFVNIVSGKWKKLGVYEDYIAKTNRLYALFVKHKIPASKLDEVFHINYGDWKMVKIDDVTSELRLDGGLHSMEIVEELLQQDKVKVKAFLRKDGTNNVYTEELTYQEYITLDETSKSQIKLKSIEDSSGRGSVKTLFPKDWTTEDISLVYKKANDDIRKILLEDFGLPKNVNIQEIQDAYPNKKLYWKNVLEYSKTGEIKDGVPIKIKVHNAKGEEIEVELGGIYSGDGSVDININTLYPYN